ncbi:MAG TPA: efflux RND transporter periplasmic adaptor subunit [Armatimonadota bacterium]|jgi:RND family efflux transporter MFP subunit
MYRQRRLGAAITVVLLLAVAFMMKAFSASKSGGAGAAPGAAGPKVEEKVPASIRVATIGRGDINETVEVSGSMTALSEVTLSAKLMAPVKEVTVREGDTVRRGQVLVRLDPADYLAQVRQQIANLRVAEAKFSQAQANLSLAEDQARSGVNVAEQSLVASRAKLAITQKGARSQERAVSQNAVESARSAVDSATANLAKARADRDLAQTNLNRQQALLRQGAVAQSSVDTMSQQMKSADAGVQVAEASLRGANRQLNSAQEQFSLMQEGARAEEIETAQTGVRTSQENLTLAQQQKQNVAAKREEVRSTRAAVAQARAILEFAKLQVGYITMVSPIDGVVATRNVEPGQMAAVGSPLLTIVNLGTVFFAASVPEMNLSDVQVGKGVSVSVDAFPGKTFLGTVAKLYPSGDSQSRTFTVRVNVPNPSGELKPGMFARGVVQVQSTGGVPVVPKDALAVAGSSIPVEQAQGGRFQSKVFVYRDGRVTLRTVTLGAVGPASVQVIQGLSEGDQVVVSGSGLQEGDTVRVAH